MSHSCAFYAKISDLGTLPDIEEKAPQFGLRIRLLSEKAELIKIYGSIADIRSFLKATGYPRNVP